MARATDGNGEASPNVLSDVSITIRRGQTVALLVTKYARAAAARCPTLATKHVSPHTLRHTNAMLLQAERIDIATIALWRLGQEDPAIWGILAR